MEQDQRKPIKSDEEREEITYNEVGKRAGHYSNKSIELKNIKQA